MNTVQWGIWMRAGMAIALAIGLAAAADANPDQPYFPKHRPAVVAPAAPAQPTQGDTE